MLSKKIAKKNPAQKANFIDEQLIGRAFSLLKEEEAKNEEKNFDLFEMTSNPFVYLNVIVSKLPETVNIRPVKLELNHSIFGKQFNTKVLLIITNELYKKHKAQLKDTMGDISIISYEKITKNFSTFANKRDLLKKYDLFFCDSRIYPLLKKSLGRAFYERKRYPYPIVIDEDEEESSMVDQLKAKIAENIEKSSYFYQGNGPEYSVKFGRVNDFTPSQIADNAKSALKGMLSTLTERGLKLQDVRRLIIKTEKSESLPIYSYLKPSEKAVIKEMISANIL